MTWQGIPERTIIVNGASSPIPTQVLPTSGAPTDRSGTITSGGVAQQAMAANSARRYLFIQNVSGGDLWYSTIGTAVQNQPSHAPQPSSAASARQARPAAIRCRTIRFIATAYHDDRVQRAHQSPGSRRWSPDLPVSR